MSSRYWQATLSRIVVEGQRGPSWGGALLLGELAMPLPNMSMETMKWRAGSIARPGPK